MTKFLTLEGRASESTHLRPALMERFYGSRFDPGRDDSPWDEYPEASKDLTIFLSTVCLSSKRLLPQETH